MASFPFILARMTRRVVRSTSVPRQVPVVVRHEAEGIVLCGQRIPEVAVVESVQTARRGAGGSSPYVRCPSLCSSITIQEPSRP